MSVTIDHLSGQDEELWSVCFGSRRIHFRNQQGAKDYAATLKERIEAPHTFPRIHHASPNPDH
ncbi:hypothetical protein D3C87_839530 [compost metagenome]|uniref:hypothetical protein n=1 Tax=Pseudomonas sp. ACN5 TaxID=1920427 RepID=UPI000F99FA40|nr:hypothetical protein [Pseudomonas sp. ACN5]PBJ07647.1 hypothetical protein BSF40_18420 [Pseudomonas sp. ACN5]